MARGYLKIVPSKLGKGHLRLVWRTWTVEAGDCSLVPTLSVFQWSDWWWLVLVCEADDWLTVTYPVRLVSSHQSVLHTWTPDGIQMGPAAGRHWDDQWEDWRQAEARPDVMVVTPVSLLDPAASWTTLSSLSPTITNHHNIHHRLQHCNITSHWGEARISVKSVTPLLRCGGWCQPLLLVVTKKMIE